jgi:transposase
MSAKRIVELTTEQREQCLQLVRFGTAHARSIMHAQVLLKTDCGAEGPGWTDQEISDAFSVSTVTISHIRQTMVEQGLEAALSHYRSPQREYRRKLNGSQEAQLIAIACSPAPEGHVRWTLRMLAQHMVELGYVDSLSHETVHQTLKKTKFSPGATCNGASRRGKTRPS